MRSSIILLLLCSFLIILGKGQQQCLTQIDHCNQCVTNTTDLCDQCDTNYTLSQNQKNCTLCLVNYCSNCQQENTCTQCNEQISSQFTLTTTPFQVVCISCEKAISCDQCSEPNYCTSCDPAQTELKTTFDGYVCVSCTIDHCLHCKYPDACQVCQNGFKLNMDQQCTSCNVQNCFSCSDDDVCQLCRDGYSLHSEVCVLCLYPCQTCDQTGNCLTCNGPQFNPVPSLMAQNNGKCFRPTVANCKIHDSNDNTICSTCNDGFELDAATNKCEPLCNQNCLTCDSGNSALCLTCRDHQYLDAASNTCLDCQQGKRSNSNNPNQCTIPQVGYFITGQDQALRCPSYCKQCSDQNTCYTLYDQIGQKIVRVGSTYNLAKCPQTCKRCASRNPQVCGQCYSGYYLIDGICKPCLGDCQTCDPNDPSVCLSCGIHQIIYDPICLPCDSNCLSCKAWDALAQCTSCYDGWSLDPESKVCIQGCPADCLKCSSKSNCLKCDTGYTTKYNAVAAGYECQRCQTNCRLCMQGNPLICIECGDGFYTVSGNQTGVQCVQLSAFCKTGTPAICTQCLDGYQLFEINVCAKRCVQPCATCSISSPTECSSCIAGYQYNPTTKQCNIRTNCNHDCNVCPSGYSLLLGNCYQCQVDNCQKCNTADLSECYSCQKGYYLEDNVCSVCSEECSSCISQLRCTACVDGFYLTSQMECLQCQINANCATCYDQPTKCSSCQEGFQLVGWRCVRPCTNTDIICQQCDENGQCIECPYGYTLLQGVAAGFQVCLQCNVQKCRSCLLEANICSQCQTGYYYDEGTETCTACVQQNCVECSSAAACDACTVGYIKQDDGNCALCQVQNCHNCFSIDYCQECDSGFTIDFVSGQCFQCQITDCKLCYTQDYCLICQTGLALNYEQGSCQACTLTGCSRCWTTDYCLKCQVNYSLDTADGECILCEVANCSRCIRPNVCTATCQAGTIATVSLEDQSTICVKCGIKQCVQCIWDDYCYKCDQSVDITNSPDVTGQKCISCNVDRCAVCSSNNICAYCLYPYTLNKKSNQCINCFLDNCQECASFGICQTCIDGYSVNNVGQCVLCPSECLTCFNNGNCKTCRQPKYNLYPSTATQNFGKCFKRTVSNCQYHDNKNNTKCQSCQLNYIYSATQNTCVLPCDFTCLECNSTNTKICITCKKGYYLDNNTTCKACTNGCDQCSDKDTCTSVSDGFFINDKGKVKSCGNKCKKCSSQTVCLELKDQYKQGRALYSSGSQTQVVYCTSNCKSCNNAQKCVQCKSGFYLKLQKQSDKQGICYPCTNTKCQQCDPRSPDKCISCFDNAFLSNKDCKQCDSNCLTCKSPTQPTFCRSCKNGFWLNKQTNQCVQGCPLNCLACSSQTDCTTCTTGYTTLLDLNLQSQTYNSIVCTPCLINCRLCAPDQPGTCIQCGAGFYNIEGQCLACPSNCKTCTAKGCTECYTGFNLLLANSDTNEKVCSPECIRPCTDCLINQPNQCTKCQAGYTLDAVAKRCNKNVGCSSTVGCSFCPTGYVLIQSTKTCQQCAVANCQKCENKNSTKCLICGIGYFLNETINQCTSCPTQCYDCYSQTQCIACVDGYVLQTKKRNKKGFACIKCDSKCLTCKDDTDKCTSCSQGYTLIGWKCQKTFRAQARIRFDTDKKTFHKNSRVLLFILIKVFGWTDPDTFNFQVIKKGSIDLTASVTLPGASYSIQATNAFYTLQNAIAVNNLANMPVINSGLSVRGGSLYSQNNGSNLSIILGVTIPLGILLLVGIVLFVVYKAKRTDGFKYSENDGTQRPTNESYSKGKIQYEDNSLI